MALPTNALTKAIGATVNHIVNGAQITDTGFSVVGDIDTAFANADGHLYVDLALTFTKAAAGSAGLTIAFYRRPLNFVSTNDQPIPSATYRSDLVGSKVVAAVSTEQFVLLQGVWVGGYACEFYIENLTGQTINATWDLDVIPWTPLPAP